MRSGELGREALAADPDLVKNRAASDSPGSPRDADLHVRYHRQAEGRRDRPEQLGILRPGPARYWRDGRERRAALLWLPMAHVFGSVLLTCQIELGFLTAVDGRVPKIMENCAVIKPTFMGAVPRIFEKVHAAITAMARAGGPGRNRVWHGASRLVSATTKPRSMESSPTSNSKPNTRKPTGWSSPRFVECSREHPLHQRVPPLSADIAEFFAAAGMPVLGLWPHLRHQRSRRSVVPEAAAVVTI